MSHIHAVIFDLDGVLLDSERKVLRELSQAAAALGQPTAEQEFECMIGFNVARSREIFAERFGERLNYEQLLAKKRELFSHHLTPLKPGVQEVLNWVRQQGLLCGLATSTLRQSVDRTLARTELAPFFNVTVCGDEVQHGKPDPEIYLRAADKLGLPPRRCIVIEDSGPGVTAALAAGMRVIHVPDIVDIGEELKRRVVSTVPTLAAGKSVLAELTTAHAIDLIHEYRPLDEKDRLHQARLVEFVQGNARCFERSEPLGHITASAWIADWTGQRVLLSHHRKLNKWIQLGGHADGDRDILGVALREAREESGIDDIRPLSRALFDLDIHAIPAIGNDMEHLHYDLRFALEIPEPRAFSVSSESLDLRWIEIEKLHEITKEESILRMREKWRALEGLRPRRPA